jgi:hypothetical protein
MRPPDVSGVCDRLHLLTSPADYATEAELYGRLLTESAEPEERSAPNASVGLCNCVACVLVASVS